MNIIQLKERNFEPEFIFTTSRSSGPGGQNVNKVNTKVELRFNVINSKILSEEEKHKLLHANAIYITNNGEIIFASQRFRSQLQNKQDVIEKFYAFLSQAFKHRKKRKTTKPGKSAIEKRLTGKKRLSEIKKNRKKIQF